MATTRRRTDAGATVLTAGFGTAVAMWAVAYGARLPAMQLGSPPLLALLMLTLVVGGAVFARWTGRGALAGAAAGAVAGLVNLLVLGSFLSGEGGVAPAALVWIPGSVGVAAALAAVGAAAARPVGVVDPPRVEPTAAFARVAVVATALLLAVGGLVTSTGSGLAVVDWPNSFGYNMFLYPFSRMTGPVYYEHTHRLFGALVGLTTLVLALLLQRADGRRWVRRLGWFTLGLVVVQGLLGGLRVTGRLTFSTEAAGMSPNLALALVHGVLGQVVFAALVVLAVVTGPAWRGRLAGQESRPPPALDRALSAGLVALLLVQLALGAAQRHFQALLLTHILIGVAVVAPTVLHVGARAVGLAEPGSRRRRLGLGLIAALAIQIGLGFFAFIASRGVASGDLAPALDVVATTAHQWFGALVLALAVALACHGFRGVGSPAPEPLRPSVTEL